jgi:hypothetical protein
MLTQQVLPSFSEKRRDRRAFLVSYGASHIAKVAPVVRELESRGIQCVVLALTIGHQKAKQLGLQPVGYQNFLSLLGDRAEQALRLGEALLPGNNHPDVDPVETRCYLGINYLEWVDELGDAGASEQYRARGRQGFMPVGFMGKILDALEPGVVIATSTPRSEEAAIRAAVLRGIPTLTMVDLFAPPSDPFLRRPVQAKRITVISEEVRERFLAAGLGAEQVVVTGSPDFDELFEPQTIEQGRAFRDRLGWTGRHVVLWAGILEPAHKTLPGAAFGQAVEQALRDWVRRTPNTALVVRYHPAQHHEFPDLGPQPGVYLSLPGHEPIAPLLQACDTVVHQVSTVGLQAALLGKRVLHLGFSAWVQKADFNLSSLGDSELVNAIEDLETALGTTSRSDFSEKMQVPPGPAAPRVANVAIQLLSVSP